MADFHIQNLSFTYPGGKSALHDVSLTIRQGEFVLLCGKSGCGKTTLLRHLKSVMQPHGQRTGTISFGGIALEAIPMGEQAAKIGFVMQNPDDQIVTDKVWHELAFGLENLGCDQKTMRHRVAEMASYFGIQGWFHREVSELSGGQKQLLNLASIMVMQPEVLILDEPTSQLDPIAAGDFLNTIQKINRDLGTTILITEHRTEDIFPTADRVIVMEDGCVTVDADPREAVRQLREQRNELFSVIPAPARVFLESGSTGQPPLTVREGRTWLDRSFPESPACTALPEKTLHFDEKHPALEVREGWFRYEKNGADILKGVTFSVPQGSLYAIVGGNGTGKSTTMKAVCGICRLYRGSIRIFGQNLGSIRKGKLFEDCICMLPQDPKSIFVHQTLREDLQEMTRDEEKIREISRLCEVEELLDSHPSDLSGGENQRAALAKVLLTSPRLLLLDEPTKGLDGFFKAKLAKLLKQLCNQGITVVMVSHDVEFCAEYADLVGMFFDGQLLTTDTPERFFGSNSFYTTAANRMSRGVFRNAVTSAQVAELIAKNRGEQV